MAEDRRQEDRRPEERRVEDKRPEDRRLGDKRPEDKKPEDRRPGDKRPEDKKPEDRRPGDKRPEDRRPEDRRTEDRRPEDLRQEDGRQKDGRPEYIRPEYIKPEDRRLSEEKRQAEIRRQAAERRQRPENPKGYLETIEVPEELKKPIEKCENHLTMSTQLSTEQLICKSPRESSNSSVHSSVKSLNKMGKSQKSTPIKKDPKSAKFNLVLYMGLLHVLFGFLMVLFGVLVILHDASLSQIGGGLWGGCLAMATGIIGVLSSAKVLCPLKDTAQRITYTVFLALSLVSLAVSQLVLVLAATGLARDINKQDGEEVESEATPKSTEQEDAVLLPENYLTLLSNIGLLLVSAVECICAAISSYQGARALCPCFKSGGEDYKSDISTNSSHAIVSSWLGKHNLPPHLYVVAAPSSIGKHSKLSGGLPITPIYAMQPPMMQGSPVMTYPLIPAPLGAVPSPIIPPPTHKEIMQRNHRKYVAREQQLAQSNYAKQKKKNRSRSKPKERVLTSEDVAKTYTGLDRIIAEEFIEICDSRNNSLCNDSSCQSSCRCQSGCTACTSSCSSDITTNDFK